MRKKKVAIYLPGRVESERLPRKLVLPIGNTTLWEIACLKLKKLKVEFGYDVYPLCNDQELIDIAEKHGLEVIYRDPDTSLVDGPLQYIFKDLEVNTGDSTHLLFMNPCLLTLRPETLDSAIKLFEDSEYDCMTSVKKYQNWLWDTEGEEPLTPINYERLTTKEIPVHYEAAHAFHLFNKKKFFRTGMMLDRNCGKFPIRKEELVDVDDAFDFQFAKFTYLSAVNKPRVVCDLDDTLFKTPGMDYENSVPDKDIVRKINNLYLQNHYIIIDTARGYMGDNERRTRLRELTTQQLKEAGVLYHELRVGVKYPADVYIDDKALNVRDLK